MIPSRTLFQCLFYYIRHKWCGFPLNDLHQKSFESLFKGRSKKEVDHFVSAFLSENLDHYIHSPVLQRLHQAQEQGHYVIIMSSSPDFLVAPIAKHLSIQEFQATIYETDETNHFVRISSVLGGQEKAEYVRLLTDKLRIPIESMTVYSDSHLDLPILKLAGKAVGVAPDSRLRRVCIAHGWEII